ncbi:MAG: SnoaL-like domain [Solirubrobacteraceae bacterium]|nr:SnoaL-like domain [Solirubrobacteraceae bacterium]
MSQENVDIVRRFNEPSEGDNLVPVIRGAVEQLGPDATPEAILAWWVEHPGWRYAHPDIEWDISATGAVGAAIRSPRELAAWWADWIEVWDSYIYRMLSYRDLGDWVLTPTQIRAHGRDGITVEMDVFQMWQVRDGKVVALRAFLSEREALEAVGLRD